MIRRWRGRRIAGLHLIRDERGDLPATLLLIPILLLLMELIIFTGRVSGTSADLNAAAAEAARAGSLASSATAATAVLAPAATAVLEQRGVPCSDPRVEPMEASQLTAGGVVAVSVYCTVKVSDLGFITQLLPIGDFEMSGAAFESIDPLRVFGTN